MVFSNSCFNLPSKKIIIPRVFIYFLICIFIDGIYSFYPAKKASKPGRCREELDWFEPQVTTRVLFT